MGYSYTYRGKEYELDVKGTNANWNLTKGEKETLIKAIIENNGPLSTQQLLDLNLLNKGANNANSARFDNVQDAMMKIINNNADKLGFYANGRPYDNTSVDMSNYNLSEKGQNVNLRLNIGKNEKEMLMQAIIAKQNMLTREEFDQLEIYSGSVDNDDIWADIENYQKTLIDVNADQLGWQLSEDGEKLNLDGDPYIEGQSEVDPQNASFNNYYNSLYDMEGPNAAGASGQALYDNLAGIYQRQAETQGFVADAQFQQQALQQAAVVKQITDQVRAERMARLKAGMSESQIANQDMQMMMANVNTLNQNANMMNQARLEGQANQYTAKDQAYMDYLGQSNTRGQVATGMYAADAGNAQWQAMQYLQQNPNSTYDQALKIVTGQTNKTE